MHKIMAPKYYLPILLLLFASISGCADQKKIYIRNGEEYGNTNSNFTEQWWDYYERGKFFSDGKFHRKAIADFKKAIKGRKEDQWRARIDDMHSLDYFPHRELGIVYFQRKQYDLAINKLENSILSAPSAKGHYFLNKARGAKIRQEGRDMSPPQLHLEGSSNKIITNSFTHIIKGVAEDESYIASIQVGETPVPMELAKKLKVFTAEVPLETGENIFRIIATDLVGKTTELNLEILCDRRGPLIEVLRIENIGEDEIIHGVVSDEESVKSLRINNRPWNITGKSSAYNFKFSRPVGGVTFIATDHAGNITKAILSDDNLKNDPLLNFQVADLESSTQDYYPNSRVVPDAHIPLVPSTQAPTDTDPPFIQLENLGTEQETYEDYILLEGKIVDFSPIHSLSINNEPISNKNGKTLYFSQLQKLSEGDNEFLIIASDTHGNKSEKKIILNRRVQNIHQIGSRLSVAVLPLDHNEKKSPTGDLINDQIIDSFVEQKRFNIVEHQRIKAVLHELELSSANPLAPDKAIDIGKIVAANTILTGTIIESSESVEIIGRLIDTETSTILTSNDVFSEDKSISSLDNLLDSLAFKFKQDFPLFEGILIEIENNEVIIDIGSEKQIKPNMHLICYREGFETKHPVTGKILGAEPDIIGELTIKEVFEGFSKARILKQKDDMRIFDRVIAK